MFEADILLRTKQTLVEASFQTSAIHLFLLYSEHLTRVQRNYNLILINGSVVFL